MNDIRAGRNFVDGAWVDSAGGGVLSVVNPATRQVVAEVPDSDERDVDLAVAAACREFGSWRWVNPSIRAGHLHAVGHAVADAETPLAESATTSSRWSGVISSPATRGRRTRVHSRARPSPVPLKSPSTKRHSIEGP